MYGGIKMADINENGSFIPASGQDLNRYLNGSHIMRGGAGSNKNPNNNVVPNPEPILSQDRYITYGQMNLINDFRTLWRDLIIWLRSYMVSTATGFSDIDAINRRLYRIPQTLNDKLQPFFGAERSEQIAQLLLMYIVHSQTLINAQVYGDRQGADAAVRDLYESSENLAEALAMINPFWSKIQWQYLLDHLASMGIQEITALVSQEYERELDIRDRMLTHALVLGDYMANGVMFYLVP